MKAMRSILTASIGVAMIFSASAVQASIIDDMEDTSHFDTFGATDGAEVIDNEDGTVTIQRNVAGQGADAGAFWGDTAQGNLFIIWSPEVDRIELNPEELVNSATRYTLNLQFRSNGAFLGAHQWLDESTADNQVLQSVDQFAQNNLSAQDYENYDRFRLQFRVFPSAVDSFDEGDEPGLTLNSIAVIPEPASMGLMGLGALLVLFAKRRLRG